MKLEKFNKNKKQKQIIIGSIIAIVMIIGGISLYRSFAMYEEKQTFDVLKGTVPDFSTKDITLAFTIDGKTDTNTKFPNKSDGYIVEEVSCEDGVTADWNNGSWSLENIKNNGEAKKVKCTVKFKTIDTTSGLNGAEPVLGKDMIPVIIKDEGKVYKTTEDNSEWYDYEAKQWANAVILTETAKNNEYEDGIIPEEDIESYFVWIPKFSYQLFDENMGKYIVATSVDAEKQNKAINIRFGVINTEDIEGECKTPMLPNGVQGASGESGHCKVGDYMTHPAFLAFDTTGFWVGKFEASNNNGIKIKPNQKAWINISIGDAFQKSLAYQIDLDSHLMKNTEWGAVAYLTQSIYGRCKDENNCQEVIGNTANGYKTGYSGASTNYNVSSSVVSSTTGNYSGIYDMSGCGWEFMASVILNNTNTEPLFGSSNLTTTLLKGEKYYDIYNYGTDYTHWERRILGDATGELGPFTYTDQYLSSMFGDLAHLPYSSSPWIVRGAPWNCNTTTCGVFALGMAIGSASNKEINAYSFRVVLTPKN